MDAPARMERTGIPVAAHGGACQGDRLGRKGNDSGTWHLGHERVPCRIVIFQLHGTPLGLRADVRNAELPVDARTT